jgi:hypothetical protein
MVSVLHYLIAIGLVICYCITYSDGQVVYLDKKKLVQARERATDVLNLIYTRYELHQLSNLQHFLVTLNLPTTGWDILKNKIIAKMLQNDSKFTFVYGGTGVTAGVDSYLHQSYPMLIEKRLAPILKALDIGFIVRNIGQVHVDCRLSNYCFDSVGGGEADVIGWENSFDCGNAKDAHEYIARVAAWRRAVVFYSTSGAYPVDDCPPSQVSFAVQLLIL